MIDVLEGYEIVTDDKYIVSAGDFVLSPKKDDWYPCKVSVGKTILSIQKTQASNKTYIRKIIQNNNQPAHEVAAPKAKPDIKIPAGFEIVEDWSQPFTADGKHLYLDRWYNNDIIHTHEQYKSIAEFRIHYGYINLFIRPINFPPPEKFEIVDDLNYIVENGDRIDFTNGGWILANNQAGKSLSKLKKQIGRNLRIATLKKDNKPRFLSDKPYPFGY